jgi:hypothetical protein
MVLATSPGSSAEQEHAGHDHPEPHRDVRPHPQHLGGPDEPGRHQEDSADDAEPCSQRGKAPVAREANPEARAKLPRASQAFANRRVLAVLTYLRAA